MSILRMNMGQKSAAKNMAKVAFGGSQPGVQLGTVAADVLMPRNGLRSSSHSFQSDCPLTSSQDIAGWVQPETFPQAKEGVDSEGVSQLRALDDKIHNLRRAWEDEEAEEQFWKHVKRDYRRQLSEENHEQAWLRRFNVSVGAIIVLNIIVIAIETDVGYDDPNFEGKIAWMVVDSLFILVFILEMAVRVLLERRAWLSSAWNWFDLAIILLAILDIWVISMAEGQTANLYLMSIFRIVRLVRLVRLVKLVRLLHGLYVILMAFWHAMQTMSFLLAIMLFGLMVYAIFATNLIGRNSNLKDVRINGDTVEDRFGTVYRSMYSLFELMTLEGWEAVARPIVEELPYLFIFIVSFIMIFTFGMLNMIVALVIEKTLHHTRMMSEHTLQEERLRMADELVRVKDLFVGGSEAGPGKITFEEFEAALKASPAVRTLFEGMGISLSSVKELYSVLDWDDSGQLSVKEFLHGLQKLQDGTVSPWDVLATHATVRSIKTQVTSINEQVSRLSLNQERFQANVEERLEKQERLLQDIVGRLEVMWMLQNPPPPEQGLFPVEHKPSLR